MVILAEIVDWKLDDWLALAKAKDWETFKRDNLIRIEGSWIDIRLSNEGKLNNQTF